MPTQQSSTKSEKWVPKLGDVVYGKLSENELWGKYRFFKKLVKDEYLVYLYGSNMTQRANPKLIRITYIKPVNEPSKISKKSSAREKTTKNSIIGIHKSAQSEPTAISKKNNSKSFIIPSSSPSRHDFIVEDSRSKPLIEIKDSSNLSKTFSDKFYPEPHEMILVTDSEEENFELREFIAMDNDVYVCKDDTPSIGYSSWKYAKKVEQQKPFAIVNLEENNDYSNVVVVNGRTCTLAETCHILYQNSQQDSVLLRVSSDMSFEVFQDKTEIEKELLLTEIPLNITSYTFTE
jgi:hypothetical protein